MSRVLRGLAAHWRHHDSRLVLATLARLSRGKHRKLAFHWRSVYGNRRKIKKKTPCELGVEVQITFTFTNCQRQIFFFKKRKFCLTAKFWVRCSLLQNDYMMVAREKSGTRETDSGCCRPNARTCTHTHRSRGVTVLVEFMALVYAHGPSLSHKEAPICAVLHGPSPCSGDVAFSPERPGILLKFEVKSKLCRPHDTLSPWLLFLLCLVWFLARSEQAKLMAEDYFFKTDNTQNSKFFLFDDG